VILIFFMEEKGWKTKAFYVLRYLGMGVAGAALYYVILQILLKLQGKVLDTYQGINSMEQGGSGLGLFATIRGMYVDFLAFTVHGNVLVNNIFSFTACAALVLLVAYLLVSGNSHAQVTKYIERFRLPALLFHKKEQDHIYAQQKAFLRILPFRGSLV